MSVKKVLLTKAIEGALYDIYPRTAAEIVNYTKGSGNDATTVSVASELASLATAIAALPTTADLNTLRTEIIGELGNDESVAASFDTIKEIAAFLDQHDESIGALAALISDVGVASVEASGDDPAVIATGIHALVEALQGRVTALETANGTNVSKTKQVSGETVTAANGHLYLDGVDTTVYSDADILSAIGADDTPNTIKGRISALEAVEANKVEAATSNGYIKVDGTDDAVLVYDDTDLVEAIGESESVAGAADGTGILGHLDSVDDDIDGLKTAVGTATSGTTAGTGLTGRMEDAESAISTLTSGTVTAVAAGSTDGTLSVTKDGTASTVTAYGGDPTVIDQDTTHRFVTDDEKTQWNAATVFVPTTGTAPTAQTALAGTLYMVEIA